MSNIADGAVVTFLCRGFYEGNRFLNGLTDAPVFGGLISKLYLVFNP
jgi:hypothetical protein